MILSWVCYVHQQGFEPVDEGAEGDATFPRRRQVCNHHIPEAIRVFLAPSKKPCRSDFWLWTETYSSRSQLKRIWCHKHGPTHGVPVNDVITEMMLRYVQDRTCTFSQHSMKDSASIASSKIITHFVTNKDTCSLFPLLWYEAQHSAIYNKELE